MNYVIFGANGAVGAEASRRLRDSGAQLLLAGRNQGELESLSEEVDAPFHVVDATNIDAVEACVADATDRFGEVDGIVNCVGSVLIKPAHITTPAEWHHTLEQNLTSAFAVVRAAYQSMKTRGGSVVLFASAAADVGIPNHEAIAAAKAGVIGLARSAAATYAAKHLRFNVIAPGLVKSKMTQSIWENERSADVSRNMHPLGRLGEPADIASLVVWLLDPANSWVTGAVINVDGGLANLRNR
jgi:NAD(P)-dependent dehydrogenase (short-subunit alcohol dehydrogenase family)